MWQVITAWPRAVTGRQFEDWHRNLAALLIAQGMTMVGLFFVVPFIPLYIKSLGVSDPTQAAQWASLIMGGASLSMAVSQPIWGNLADHWGRRPILIQSLATVAVIVFLMGFVTGPEQFLALRLIQGALTSTHAAANALMAAITPRHRLGFALGMLQMSSFVGACVGPLIGGIIADAVGFRASFFAAAFLLAAAAAVVIRFVREQHVQPSTSVNRRSVWSESRALFAIAIFPSVIGLIFLINMGTWIVQPVLSLFVAELSAGGNAATLAGISMAVLGVASAASAMLLGRIGDRLGHTRILLICLLGAAIVYLPQAAVQQFWQLLILQLLLGLFVGGLMPAANALLAQIVPPERRGAAFGLAGTAIALSNGAAPLTGAGVVTQWGMRAVFLAAGILYALTFVWAGLRLRTADSARRMAQER